MSRDDVLQLTQTFAYYGLNRVLSSTGLATGHKDDASTTTYAYDLGGKLTAIGRSGTADDASFTFGALGRLHAIVSLPPTRS